MTDMNSKVAMHDALAKIRKGLNLTDENSVVKQYEDGIADIITFCYDPKLLDLPGSNFRLHRSQEIVLKALYMGATGNRNLTLSPEDWKWLEDNALSGDNQHSLNKLRWRERMRSENPAFRFTELALVLGRRSGKTLLSSVIASYEAYKLLVINHGDPHAYYGIPMNKQIWILNVATSMDNAGELFGEIKARIGHGPFFRNRVEHDTDSMIRLLTDRDLRQREDHSTNVKLQGSIIIRCGHSNPKTLRGKAAICIIFDELAFYDESKKISGKDFYNALKPSIAQFDKKNDGLLVEISSPGPKGGIFHTRAEIGMQPESPTMVFRMPTWVFNPDMPETNALMADDKRNNPEMYAIEFGAEWPEGGASSSYFPEALITRAIEAGGHAAIMEESAPRYGADYYGHIDPAISGDNYAMVIVRKSSYRDKDGVICPRPVLAFVKAWKPIRGKGLDLLAIENEIIEISHRFRLKVLSYDRLNSPSTLAVLRRNGINTICTPYGGGYKMKIYQNLKDLMCREECALQLYSDPLLIAELKNLKQKPLQRGTWIGADKRSDVKTDDAADCLAGAAFMSCGNYYLAWPGATIAYTGRR